MSSNPNPPVAPGDGPDVVRQQQHSGDALRTMRYSSLRRVVVPALTVLSVGLGLFLAWAATYHQACSEGRESGLSAAYDEFEAACVNDKSFNDSLRLLGARKAAFELWEIGAGRLPKHSQGFCFLKQEFIDSLWSAGSIYNLYVIMIMRLTHHE